MGFWGMNMEEKILCDGFDASASFPLVSIL
jgi:hypothetical protein